MQIKVVLDTNIYISGLITRGGKPDLIIKKIENYHLFCAEEILEEIKRVLQYPKIKNKYSLTEDDIEDYLIYIRSVATIVTSLPEVKIIEEDTADNIILACADKANADYIISGDKHLKNLKEYKGIKILAPAEFLQIL